MAESLSSMRIKYSRATLGDCEVAIDPFMQFTQWFDDALDSDAREANAMIVATATRDGVPSARTVLLKGFDTDGFVFYTNYQSRKGQEVEHNPHVAAVFYWSALERQVRIEGTITRTSAEQSDAYFHERPRGSQIGAIASAQSDVVDDRDTLERTFREVESQVGERKIERPEWWGGYRIEPKRFEFWQGRPDRMHDRITYERAGDAWEITRLQP